MGKSIKTYETIGTQTLKGDVQNEMRKEKIKEIMASGGNEVELFQVAKEKWPHGCRRQCSEVAVPALVGSNPTEGGGFFRRKETPPGHGCVCMSSRG
jgi:hypothetical protein